jgi:hypothetical protein
MNALIRTCTIVLLLLVSAHLRAQKLLQLEKSGTLKTVRFYIGQDITFQLRNDDKGWLTRTITDIDVDGGHLVFQNHSLHIDSIAVIRLPRTNAMQIAGVALQVGGVNAIIFSLGYSPIFKNEPVNWGGVGFGALGIAVGTALRQLFKTKKFKPRKRKRLRLLDLNFGPVFAPPAKT